MLVPRTVDFRPHQQSSCTCFLELADVEGLRVGQNASPIPQVLLGLDPTLLQDFLNPAHYLPARAKVTRGTKRLMLPLQTSLSGASGPRRKFQHCPLSAASFVGTGRKEGHFRA